MPVKLGTTPMFCHRVEWRLLRSLAGKLVPSSAERSMLDRLWLSIAVTRAEERAYRKAPQRSYGYDTRTQPISEPDIACSIRELVFCGKSVLAVPPDTITANESGAASMQIRAVPPHSFSTIQDGVIARFGGCPTASNKECHDSGRSSRLVSRVPTGRCGTDWLPG